jgi:mannose-6-phosphate isomerase-like protein (cupin superfamily)
MIGLLHQGEFVMGRAVTFSDLQPSKTISGVHNAAITQGETQEMAAEYIRIAPGQQWIATVLPESDCYLFMIDGACAISVADSRHRFSTQAFAVVQEGIPFSVENDSSAPASIIKVIAPPQPNGRGTPGFTGKLAVMPRASAPIVDLPKEKKKRIYFVDDDAIRSQRGHAMIVVYEKDTVASLHHHPNAESMFVVLEGALQFIVNGEPVVLTPGQAVYFGVNDQHALRVADGASSASFLEFHIPAAYSTVRRQA